MLSKLKRRLFDFIKRLNCYREENDLCELCHEETADYICVGCDRQICGACDSAYYRDAELCTDCRAKITPEEEEQDRRESAESLAEECTCGTGGRPCDLSDEEHEFLRKYAHTEASQW
jgi:hypothetical protein